MNAMPAIFDEHPEYKFLIVGDGPSKKDLEELGIIGVTCVLNLISGGYQSAGMGIPPQCVLLNHVSCSKHWLSEDCPSTIDVQELSNKI